MDATEQPKIFVCWSGERGRGFAEACQKWLGDLFPERVNVLISVEIEKGTVWFDELTDSLRGARLGIICLTPEGIDSPWVHFEAGMLAKDVHEDQTLTPVPGATRSRILPFLLGVEWALAGPLGAYQGTSATDKNDAWRLIESVAAVMPPMEPDGAKELRKRFRNAWEGFQLALKAIKPVELRKVIPEFEHWFDRKTFNESMYDCGWIDTTARERWERGYVRINVPSARPADDSWATSSTRLFPSLMVMRWACRNSSASGTFR